MNLTTETLVKLNELMPKDPAGLISLLKDIWNGNLSLKGYSNELEGILAVVEDSVKEFSDSEPIKSRRAAISYANSLIEVIHNTGEYSSMVLMQEVAGQAGIIKFIQMVQQELDGKLNLYNVNVFMVISNDELLIASLFPTNEELLNVWTKELSIYEENGYYVGADKPLTTYFEKVNKVVRVLPDVGPFLQ